MRLIPQSNQNRPMPEQTHPQYRYPSQKHLTPSHCGHCGARLLVGEYPSADHPAVDVSCLYCSHVTYELVHDGMRVYRDVVNQARALFPERTIGRPVGTTTVERRPCAGGCGLMVHPKQSRCRRCYNANRAATALQTRLVEALVEGPRHRSELCFGLGITVDTLGHTAVNARAAGHRIAYRDGWYSMEGQP